MALKKRLIVFVALFVAAIIFDWLKFLFSGKSNLINWHSFAHPAWVIGAAVFLIAGIVLWRERVWQILFWLHFFVFFAAFANQFFLFSETLTYNCMLFNLVFVALYFVLSAPHKRSEISLQQKEAKPL